MRGPTANSPAIVNVMWRFWASVRLEDQLCGSGGAIDQLAFEVDQKAGLQSQGVDHLSAGAFTFQT